MISNSKFKKRFYALGLCLALVGCNEQAAIQSEVEEPLVHQQEAEKKPNFLIITTDDMGYTDLGAFGGKDIPTPNLDSLAMQGVRLTNYRTNVSCAPTRSMLMSGTGNHEAGMGSQWQFPEFDGKVGYEGHIADRVATLPERLRAAGYHTYMAGKWHLGKTPGLNLPGDRGFERSFALLPGGFDHFKTPEGAELPDVGNDLAVPYSEDGQLLDELADDFYSTTVYVDKIIEYLKSNEADGQPFFAWFAPTAPHWPLQVLPEWKDKFVGVYEAGYEALCHERQQGGFDAEVLPANADFTICPEIAEQWDKLSDDEKALNRRVMELYAAMVAHLDAEFGRITAYLEDTGQLENTYIIYNNDNGPQGGDVFDHRAVLSRFNNSLENLGNPDSWVNVGQGWADAHSAPFRKEKGSYFDGGSRVAAFIRSPNSTESGRTSGSLVTVMDILPTILDLAGIDESDYKSANEGLMPIRGKSFAGLLDNENQQIHAPDEPIALDHAGLSVLIQGDWKIMREPMADNWQLYNTANDPNELNDVSLDHADIVADLVSKFENHADETGILRRTAG